MPELPYEVKLQLLKQVKDMKTLKNICSIDGFEDICKENWDRNC